MALKKFLMVAFVAAVLVACGDDSSSATDSDEVSSSSVCKDCDDSSSSKAKSSSSSAKSSSSSAKSSSSAVYVEPCRTDSVDTCEYGDLVDERDGQTYKTVKIGMLTWMAENLNYKTDSSYCYGDKSSNCTKYGRLYTWDAAKTACPAGWHLPTDAEFGALYINVGGQFTAATKLKSTSGWGSACNGTDDYSFSALPAGYRHRDEEYYSEISSAFFWSSTEYDSDRAYSINLKYDDYTVQRNFSYKNVGYSVRCLKDLQAE